MTPCLDEASILAFGRGDILPSRKQDAESHIAICEECRVLVSAVRRASSVDPIEAHGPVAAAPAPAPLIVEPVVTASVQPRRRFGGVVLVAACAGALFVLGVVLTLVH